MLFPRVLLCAFFLVFVPLVVAQADSPGACMTFCGLSCSDACDTSNMYMCGSHWCGCQCTSADNLPGNQAKKIGTIVGIVFGCIAGVGLLIGLCFVCFWRHSSTYNRNRRYVATTTFIVAETTTTPVVQNINVVNVPVPNGQINQPMPPLDPYGQPMYGQPQPYQPYQPPQAYAQSTPIYQEPYTQPQQPPPAYTV